MDEAAAPELARIGDTEMKKSDRARLQSWSWTDGRTAARAQPLVLPKPSVCEEWSWITETNSTPLINRMRAAGPIPKNSI